MMAMMAGVRVGARRRRRLLKALLALRLLLGGAGGPVLLDHRLLADAAQIAEALAPDGGPGEGGHQQKQSEEGDPEAGDGM